MTDIVERLYEMADDTTHELAAEEITRLRAEIERLRAEAARLRAELLRVVEHADMAPELYASDADVWRGMADIARAALKETDHG